MTPNEGVINGVRGLNDVAQQQGTETGPSPQSSAVVSLITVCSDDLG